MDEILAQLNNLLTIGFKISYLDTHMLPELYIDGLSSRIDEFCIKHNLINHKYYYNFPDIDPKKALESFEKLPDGQYFMLMHPSIESDESRLMENKENKGIDVAKNRNQEYLMLIDYKVKLFFYFKKIKTITYSKAIPFEEDLLEKHASMFRRTK
jgi:hypothetical protein